MPEVPKVEHMLEVLEKSAKSAAHCGLVEFFGCSKCRWSSSGCISWKCNPEKFKKHFEKFPWKYTKSDVKELKPEDEKKLSIKELVGDTPADV